MPEFKGAQGFEGATALLLFSSGLSLLSAQKAPSPAEQDRTLAAIREYALNYPKEAPPRFECLRVTHYKGLSADDNVPTTGSSFRQSFSLREFRLALHHIFAPEAGISFHWLRSAKLRGRPVVIFSFEVPHDRGMDVYDNVAGRDVVVGYSGQVYADAESKAVLRIETHSSDFANDAEFTGIDLALDYNAAKIGDREFILPNHLELVWHRRRPATSAKTQPLPRDASIEAEYKNYRSSTAKSALSFDRPDSQDVHSAITFGDVASPEKK